MTDDLFGRVGDSRLEATYEVPRQTDVLPDGREVVKVGDVDRFAELGHRQGDNDYKYEGDCGLCSCESVLRQFGSEVTENDIVHHAVVNHECVISDKPDDAGGTTMQNQVDILGDYGVKAHLETGRSLDDLATDVEQGKGVIIEANAGVLWDDATYYGQGEANHAVTVTGVARDPETGAVLGVYINDSGAGQFGRFVDAQTMGYAWTNSGGQCVVTDGSRIADGSTQ